MAGTELIHDMTLVLIGAAGAAWLCQLAGVPLLAGYLVAGMCLGPAMLSWGAEPGASGAQSLAQFGLVFLMFRLGQGVRVQRLRTTEVRLILAAVIYASLVLVACRGAALLLGWPPGQGLVLGGMFMVASASVVEPCLRRSNAAHRRHGQAALKISALTNVLGILFVAFLAALAEVGRATDGLVSSVLRLNAALVAVLMAFLLLVPSLLERGSRHVGPEARNLITCGLLFALATLSAKLGFPSALGAFLLGMVVSSTSKEERAEPVLAPMCAVFEPVFFVSMGMLFGVTSLSGAWPVVLGLTLLALVLRWTAATAALVLVGQPAGEAARTSANLAPLGEFTLLIALTAVQGGIAPPYFYAVSVVICLLTSAMTPHLIRNSAAIGAAVERCQPRVMSEWLRLYQDWITALGERQRASRFWRIASPRLVQLSVMVLTLSGMLIFGPPLYRLVVKWTGPEWPFRDWRPILFSFAYGAVLLPPAIALYRNVEAVAMICADSAAHGRPNRAVLKPIFEKLFKGAAVAGMLTWFSALLPLAALPGWGWAGVLVGLALLATAFWRQLVKAHSRVEIEVKTQLAASAMPDATPEVDGLSSGSGDWNLNLAETSIREGSQAVGKALRELPLRAQFSCTLVSIERQGLVLPNPNSASVLYPNDKVLLLGRDENLSLAQRWLDTPSPGAGGARARLADLSLRQLTVPAASKHTGRALGELELTRQFGVQVVGIGRARQSLVSPGASEVLQPGDQLLVLGTPEQVNELIEWLSN